MKHVIDQGTFPGSDSIFGPWLMEKLDAGEWFSGRGHTIGLVEPSGRIVGACLFESCNGASVVLHCASEGRDWLNREFLWYTFYYPFVELGVQKIISPVEEGNKDCIRFIEHIGFNLEATLQDASPKGNLLLYTMSKKNCKWLDLKDLRNNGQAQSSRAT